MTKENPAKGREFYIYSADRGMFFALENEQTYTDDIHVIEHTAYQSLEEDLEYYKRELEKACERASYKKDFTEAYLELEKLARQMAEALEKYEKVIRYCHKACLCERFETYGFDYHEKHPTLGNKGGIRSNTPKKYIEDMIGFEWAYEKPEGVCKSWKEFKFKALKAFREWDK